jgi:sugar-specific transcriptional regulator TrmB
MIETVNGELVDKLRKIGFSEYEARAYLALLRKSPITGYRLAKLSDVPRSVIYKIAARLTARGAAVKLSSDGAIKYAPIPAAEFLDRLQWEYGEIIADLKDDLGALTTGPDLEYVWSIEGHENIIARARQMIEQANTIILLATLPDLFPALQGALAKAVERGVRVVLYSTKQLELPGSRIIVTPIAADAAEKIGGLRLILTIEHREALIGEWLTEAQARASWTSSPALVSIAEHHLIKGGRRRFLINRDKS